jgi:glycosyltransferase involved in cell wall biosynthesis
MTPHVSFLLTVRNDASYLHDLIASVVAQTYQNWELVAVDDGSTDGSLAMLHQAASRENRIRVVASPAIGRSAALNLGLSHCQGGLIAIVDSDDRCLPERLADQVAFMDTHPTVVLCGGHYQKIDAAGQVVAEAKPLPTDDAAIRALLATENPFCHGTVMVRREAILAAGGYREAFGAAVDYDMILRVATLPVESGPSDDKPVLAILPQVLYQYRVHASGFTHGRRLLQLQLKRLAQVLYAQRLTCDPDDLMCCTTLAAQHQYVAAFLKSDRQHHASDYRQALWQQARRMRKLGNWTAAGQLWWQAAQLMYR